VTLYAVWKIEEIEGMVWISAGTFTMGSPTTEANRSDNETQHSVTLTQGFYMGKYQVTQAQYQAVMGSNPSGVKGRVPPETNTANRPVEMVSWYDALVFCNKLSMQEGLSPAYRINGSTDPAAWGTVPTSSNSTWNAVTIVAGSDGYRLPTEAQWEYACRAGTATAYNTGETISDNTGWYSSNSGSRTHTVGEKPANAWGLYDMHGNVYEWCWDWYGTYASGAQTDPTGAVSGSYRVIRGGSWYYGGQYLRSAYRNYYYPDGRSGFIGFRLVCP
jgi:formylglycine-generating enzyme required for sulfatase activity